MLTSEGDIANQKLNALRGLWDQKRVGRAMPCRADLTVAELRPWLGNLALIDLGDNGETFRLCGINLFPRFGGDATGRSSRDLRGEGSQSFQDCIARVRATVLPSSARHAQIIHGESVTFDELGLPLSIDGSEVKVVLFASYPAMAKTLW